MLRTHRNGGQSLLWLFDTPRELIIGSQRPVGNYDYAPVDTRALELICRHEGPQFRPSDIAMDGTSKWAAECPTQE